MNLSTRYSRTIRTSATGSGVAAWELIANPVKGCLLVELAISLVNATASTFALGRPAAAGITPTTPVLLLPENAGDPFSCGSKLAVAWGTGPTIPAAYLRQVSLPATVGAERIWRFSRSTDGDRARSGIVVPAGGTIILWTLSTVSIADVVATIEE